MQKRAASLRALSDIVQSAMTCLPESSKHRLLLGRESRVPASSAASAGSPPTQPVSRLARIAGRVARPGRRPAIALRARSPRGWVCDRVCPVAIAHLGRSGLPVAAPRASRGAMGKGPWITGPRKSSHEGGGLCRDGLLSGGAVGVSAGVVILTNQHRDQHPGQHHDVLDAQIRSGLHQAGPDQCLAAEVGMRIEARWPAAARAPGSRNRAPTNAHRRPIRRESAARRARQGRCRRGYLARPRGRCRGGGVAVGARADIVEHEVRPNPDYVFRSRR